MGDVGNAGMEAWGGNDFQAPQAAQNGVPAQQAPVQPPPTGAPAPDAPQPPAAPPSDPLVDRMNLLLESVVHIGHAAGNAHQEQLINRQALEALVHRLENLSTGTPAASTNSSSRPPRGNVRVRDPRIFNGKASEVDAFLEEVDAAILLQPALRDADETVKCHYFVSWLGDGAPRSWLKAMKNRDLLFLDDYMALVYEFRKRFEDSDIENKMIHKIEALKQEVSAAVYANQFEEYLRYINWTEAYAIKRFERGLKQDVRMQLLGKLRPATLSEWIPHQQGVRVTTSNTTRQSQPQRSTTAFAPTFTQRPTAAAPQAAPLTLYPWRSTPSGTVSSPLKNGSAVSTTIYASTAVRALIASPTARCAPPRTQSPREKRSREQIRSPGAPGDTRDSGTRYGGSEARPSQGRCVDTQACWCPAFPTLVSCSCVSLFARPFLPLRLTLVSQP